MCAESSVLAEIQASAPGVSFDVRDEGGEFVGRVNRAGAAELIGRGWATAAGRRRVKYLRLEPGSPWPWKTGDCSLVRGNNVRRIRNDAGVLVGAPKTGLEHRPAIWQRVTA